MIRLWRRKVALWLLPVHPALPEIELEISLRQVESKCFPGAGWEILAAYPKLKAPISMYTLYFDERPTPSQFSISYEIITKHFARVAAKRILGEKPCSD